MCPVCGNKTRLKIREDTELKKFPLYCPKCRQENLIEIKQFKVTVIILAGRRGKAGTPAERSALQTEPDRFQRIPRFPFQIALPSRCIRVSANSAGPALHRHAPQEQRERHPGRLRTIERSCHNWLTLYIPQVCQIIS